MSRDYYDQLIDQLLRESLGGDRPRDLTSRVMALAKAHDRTHRNWWISAGAALAASIAVALTLWAVWPQQYPKPVGENLLVFGSEFSAGTKVSSPENSSGSLTLGGYVNMDVAPNTSFTLGGGPRYQEKVLLQGGHLDVTTKKKGTFQLLVGPATVQVSNTIFGVDVNDSYDETNQKFLKRFVVTVLEGSAEVSGVETPVTLRAGDSQTFTVSEEIQPHLVERAQPPAQSPDANPPTYRPGRGMKRVAPNGNLPGTAQIQIIIGPGPYSLDGILRHDGAYMFLQTDHGNFLLGTLENFDDRPPALQSYVHVVFGKGRVTRIELAKPPFQPALPPPAQATPAVSTPIHL